MTSLNDLADEWIRGRRRRGELTADSAEVLRSRLRSLTAFATTVEDLRVGTIDQWRESIGDRAESTRRHYLSTARNFTRWLIKEGLVETNPFDDLPPVKEPRRPPRALSPDQVGRVLSACRTSRDRAMVSLMVQTGVRAVEVARLEMAEVDFEAGRIRVRGKGGHERELPVPIEAMRDLLDYVKGDRPTGSRWVFVSAAGQRLQRRWVGKRLNRIMRDSGVHVSQDGRSAHALRHTAASDVLEQSLDLRVVQEMLGHKHLSSTQIYLRRPELARLATAMEGRRYGSRVIPPESPKEEK